MLPPIKFIGIVMVLPGKFKVAFVVGYPSFSNSKVYETAVTLLNVTYPVEFVISINAVAPLG